MRIYSFFLFVLKYFAKQQCKWNKTFRYFLCIFQSKANIWQQRSSFVIHPCETSQSFEIFPSERAKSFKRNVRGKLLTLSFSLFYARYPLRAKRKMLNGDVFVVFFNEEPHRKFSLIGWQMVESCISKLN